MYVCVWHYTNGNVPLAGPGAYVRVRGRLGGLGADMRHHWPKSIPTTARPPLQEPMSARARAHTHTHIHMHAPRESRAMAFDS